ncbi:MAG: hypothetical protein ACTSWY_04190 [Promethearchaeota archaeon]
MEIPPNMFGVTKIFPDSDPLKSLSLVQYKIYEAICLIKSQTDGKIDASTIGIRFENEDTMILNLDRTSISHGLLRLPPQNPRKTQFSINFSDDVFLLSRIMLKEENIQEKKEIILEEEYSTINDIPFLISSRASISAEIISEIKEFEIKGREFYLKIRDPLAQKKFPARFRAIIINKFRSSYASQPMSMYDFKAITAISLIKEIFHIKKNILKYPNGGKKVFELLNRARSLQKEIRTFSGGVSSLKVANWIDDLIIRVMAFS